MIRTENNTLGFFAETYDLPPSVGEQEGELGTSTAPLGNVVSPVSEGTSIQTESESEPESPNFSPSAGETAAAFCACGTFEDKLLAVPACDGSQDSSEICAGDIGSGPEYSSDSEPIASGSEPSFATRAESVEDSVLEEEAGEIAPVRTPDANSGSEVFNGTLVDRPTARRISLPKPRPLTQREFTLLRYYGVPRWDIAELNRWLSNPSEESVVDMDIPALLRRYAGAIMAQHGRPVMTATAVMYSLESLGFEKLPSLFDLSVACENLKLPEFFLGSEIYYDIGALRDSRLRVEGRKDLLKDARPIVRHVLAFGHSAIYNLTGPRVLCKPSGPNRKAPAATGSDKFHSLVDASLLSDSEAALIEQGPSESAVRQNLLDSAEGESAVAEQNTAPEAAPAVSDGN